MLIHQFPQLVAGCIGAADNGNGTYRLDFSDGTKRNAAPAEIAAAEAATIAEAAERKAADDQQSAGIVEAKRAYARMQTIIDNADTATTVQLRAAIKEMARDIQHLIRAAVR